MSEIIAKAMNSTLGTSNFKSFDEIFLSERCLAPSSEVLAAFPGVNTTFKTSTKISVARLSFPLKGSATISYQLYANVSTSVEAGAYMYIYVGGELHTTVYSTAAGEPSSFSKVTISFDAGEIIEIAFESKFSTKTASLRLSEIQGTVHKTKALDVEVLL